MCTGCGRGERFEVKWGVMEDLSVVGCLPLFTGKHFSLKPSTTSPLGPRFGLGNPSPSYSQLSCRLPRTLREAFPVRSCARGHSCRRYGPN